jgi:hypothetical protein
MKMKRGSTTIMKRAQIQIDEEVYELLQHRAFREKKSIAKVIREIIKKDVIHTNQHRAIAPGLP